MIDLITNNLDAIRKACEDHDLKTLWVFRNVIAYQYDAILEEHVWQIIHDDLVILISTLVAILAGEN